MDPSAQQPPPSVPPMAPEVPASQPVASAPPVVSPVPSSPPVPPAAPSGQPVVYTPSQSTGSGGHGSKLPLVLFVGVLLTALVGGGAYVFMSSTPSKQTVPVAQQPSLPVTQPPQPTLSVDQQIDNGVDTLDTQINTIDSDISGSIQGLSDKPVDLSH